MHQDKFRSLCDKPVWVLMSEHNLILENIISKLNEIHTDNVDIQNEIVNIIMFINNECKK